MATDTETDTVSGACEFPIGAIAWWAAIIAVAFAANGWLLLVAVAAVALYGVVYLFLSGRILPTIIVVALLYGLAIIVD